MFWPFFTATLGVVCGLGLPALVVIIIIFRFGR